MLNKATATISFYWDESRKHWLLIANMNDNRAPIYLQLSDEITAAVDRSVLDATMRAAGEVLDGLLW